MQHPSLETLAERLSEQLRCEQEDLCRPIIQHVARGKPVAPAVLSVSLHISQDELKQRLASLPETEFDRAGNIVGWGITLVPTSHRFQIRGQPLFTETSASGSHAVSTAVEERGVPSLGQGVGFPLA